jgi:hypothetical protein
LLINTLVNEEKSLSSFQTAIRRNVRALWNGTFQRFDFIDNMRAAIEVGFRQAWAEGAAQCGVSMEELSNEEREQLERMTNSQFPFLPGFADDIIEGNQVNGGKLQPLLGRSGMWVNRYNIVKDQAGAMACANQKMKWFLGATEQHCNSCGGFAGRVYRYSTWLENGALPRSDTLCCNGYKCGCELEPTTDKITPGPFPKSFLVNCK